jgi:hypothetical protein
MNLQFEKYEAYIKRVPDNGKHILAYTHEDTLVVYQAYNREIAEYAVANQRLGGPAYKYSRMSWIKPNFLWMMYRSGWATKQDQERVLAIYIKKSFFNSILDQAVHSSFQNNVNATDAAWKVDLEAKEVRVQWDPDHDPIGTPQKRRAIQLGLSGRILKEFGQSQIVKVDDITDFVAQQRGLIDARKIQDLLIPNETVFIPDNVATQSYLGLS